MDDLSGKVKRNIVAGDSGFALLALIKLLVFLLGCRTFRLNLVKSLESSGQPPVRVELVFHRNTN